MTEADLHAAVVAEIRRTWPSALLVPGIGELPEAGERRLQAWRMGYTKGQPDLMILNSAGTLAYLVKFAKGDFQHGRVKN